MNKKDVRAAFRKAVLERDGHRCAMCGRADVKLDAHHIIDRKQMPNGGYVPENGITLCDCDKGCHWKAEQFHATGVAWPGYTPADLFARIGSSEEVAKEASYRLAEPLAGQVIQALKEGIEWAQGKRELKTTHWWAIKNSSGPETGGQTQP